MKRHTASRLLSVAIAAALAAVFASAAFAAGTKPVSIDFETGKVAQDGDDLYHVGILAEFRARGFFVTPALNLYFDRELRMRDNANDILVLDSAGYESDRLTARYGDIEQLTWGRGFVVRNYYSNTMNNVPDNEQKGFLLDRKTEVARLAGFMTLSHLVGLRGERTMGRAAVGTTVISDSDPEFKIWGLDASYRLQEETRVYAEAAEIEHYGTGSAVGVLHKPINWAQLMVEYRKFDADFVPGIVDEHYEARPVFNRIAANPQGNIDGYFAQASLFSDTLHPIMLSWEDYEASDPRGTAGVEVRDFENLTFGFYYAQENLVPSGALFGEDSVFMGRASFILKKHLVLNFDYYRAFDDAKQPLESFDFNVRARL